LADDGTLLYVAGEGGGAGELQLDIVDAVGNTERMTLAPRPLRYLTWSPDGETVAFVSSGQVFLFNTTLGSTPSPVTFDGLNFGPVFSPDGRRIAFGSLRAGSNGGDVFVKELTDDSPPRSLGALAGNNIPTHWPSEDVLVGLTTDAQGSPGDLWWADLSDPDSARVYDYLVSEADLRAIQVSPDGTLAVYESGESGIREVYIRSFPEPGQQTLVSEGVGIAPAWSPDGNTIYYVRPDEGVSTIMAARMRRNPVPTVVAREEVVSGPYVGLALHPDGDRWIVARGASVSDDGEVSTRLILVQNFFEVLRERVPN
jgi:Tol biopolymer transport system component